MAKRRTKKQIEDDARIAEIALAVRASVVAMRPSEAVAAQAYSALYRDVLINMLAHSTTNLTPEIACIVERKMCDAFDSIVHDVQELVSPSLKPDTFMPPIEQQRAYH